MNREDIDKNHTGNVATILHECFDYLPQTDGIFQGHRFWWYRLLYS